MNAVVERAFRALAAAGFGAGQNPEPESLEDVLAGKAIELWSDLLGERLWLVANEADARRLGEPRGSVYTAAEGRMVCRITDKMVVGEIHRYKRRFDATVAEYRQEGGK